MVAVALFLLPAVIAMALVLRHHQLDATIVTIVVTVALPGGLPVTWLTWATYREARKPASPQTMAQVADQLALAVDTQWKAEAACAALMIPTRCLFPGLRRTHP